MRSAAVAAVVLLGAAGCASGGPAAARPAAGQHARQQLTPGQARTVFGTFWPAFERLSADYSPSAARRLTTGAELAAQLFFRGTSGPSFTGLTGESFYVPRLTGYPRWFWAAGQDPGGARNGHLFVMVQSAPSAPWKTAMALYDLGSSAHLLRDLGAAVATDALGYAQAVPAADTGLDVPPPAMPAAYASYLDGTGSQAVRRLFRPGPSTTGYISLDRQIFRGAGRYGWRDTDRQAPSRLPVYALRLSTGGAVVIFSTHETAGWTALSSAAALPAQPSGSEANYVPPALVVHSLGITSVRAGARLTATAVDRVLAFVPPRKTGSISIVISNGAAIQIQEIPAG